MHNLETLVADISALLKKSGDSGDSGDNRSKAAAAETYVGVATRGQNASPLKQVATKSSVAPAIDWRQATTSKRVATEKAGSDQSLIDGVATVASVSTRFQQGRAPTLAPGSVAEWHATLDELTALDPPEWASPVRWQNMIFDADAFCTRWGIAADQLGWTTLDLFGVHPNAPADRYDVMGLLLLIQGGTIVALATNAATIRRPSQSILTYRRPNAAGGVLVTEAAR